MLTTLGREIPLGQVFTILLLMLGPFKMVGRFLQVTKDADAALTRQVALRATVFSAMALLVAGFLGEFFLGRYGVPLPVLALAGGIILFLVALKNILEQFETPEPQEDGRPLTPQEALKSAVIPLAFPSIVTPYGIAILIVFIAFTPTLEGRLAIGAVVLGIVAANLAIMLLARRLRGVLFLVLPILGAVLGVIQVGIGLQIINGALRMIGAPT
jgi:multiple antibiotic resistance protein